MSPEMSTPLVPLVIVAILAWLACGLVFAIGGHMTKQVVRRASYRASNQQGDER
ncbi:MAG: hypothetical protein JWP75_2927 [Frondihabitans sp.]|nr:hypothetical protein [Frondihabitans sp.]